MSLFYTRESGNRQPVFCGFFVSAKECEMPLDLVSAYAHSPAYESSVVK
jgi:hypothetical protein